MKKEDLKINLIDQTKHFIDFRNKFCCGYWIYGDPTYLLEIGSMELCYIVEGTAKNSYFSDGKWCRPPKKWWVSTISNNGFSSLDKAIQGILKRLNRK